MTPIRSSLSTRNNIFLQRGATDHSSIQLPNTYLRQYSRPLQESAMSRDRYAFGTLGTCAAYLDTSPIARLVQWAMRVCGASNDNTESEKSLFYQAEDDEAQPSAAQKEPHTTNAGEGETRHATCANHVIANHQNNKVYKWPLGRRIFIAAVISWYTYAY